MASRRNGALKLFVNGRRARDLHGLADPLGNLLSAYDLSTTRAVAGLKRRALPAVSRAVRANYNIKARDLSGKYRVEMGTRGRRGDKDDFLSIWASTRRTPLLAFGGRPGPRPGVRGTPGARAAVTRGSAKSYDGAFIATVQGRRAIRVRRLESTGRRAGRGPLRMLRGPSPFEMLSGLDHAPSQATQRAVMSELTVFYTAELRRQFRLTRGSRG